MTGCAVRDDSVDTPCLAIDGGAATAPVLEKIGFTRVDYRLAGRGLYTRTGANRNERSTMNDLRVRLKLAWWVLLGKPAIYRVDISLPETDLPPVHGRRGPLIVGIVSCEHAENLAIVQCECTDEAHDRMTS